VHSVAKCGLGMTRLGTPTLDRYTRPRFILSFEGVRQQPAAPRPVTALQWWSPIQVLPSLTLLNFGDLTGTGVSMSRGRSYIHVSNGNVKLSGDNQEIVQLYDLPTKKDAMLPP
jgi:hypothetical protein